jgi:hypothetical protein
MTTLPDEVFDAVRGAAIRAETMNSPYDDWVPVIRIGDDDPVPVYNLGDSPAGIMRAITRRVHQTNPVTVVTLVIGYYRPPAIYADGTVIDPMDRPNPLDDDATIEALIVRGYERDSSVMLQCHARITRYADQPPMLEKWNVFSADPSGAYYQAIQDGWNRAAYQPSTRIRWWNRRQE